MILVLGKVRSHRAPNLAFGKVGGWVARVTWVIWRFAKNLCRRCDVWVGALVEMKLPVASCLQLRPSESSEESSQRNVQAQCKMWCRFMALLAQSFWMRWSHSTQAHSKAIPPPLTSTVKSSLFTHVHSSPLSLAARLHWCHANHSHILMLDRLFLDRPLYVIVIFLEARTLGKFLWKKEETLKKKETN